MGKGKRLQMLVGRLRRAIEPCPGTPRYVLTAPCGGYEFGFADQRRRGRRMPRTD